MDESNHLWQTILSELRLQMTTATYDTWLNGSTAIQIDSNTLLVTVKNDYAKDWLENRLHDSIMRTAVAVTKNDLLRIHYTTESQGVNNSTQPINLSHPPASPTFPGFEPIRSNFVMTPRQFYEIVLRGEKPTVTAVVAAVIANTVGVVVNYHTGEAREWWEANYEEIGRAAGIKSRVSVRNGIRAALRHGYIVARQRKIQVAEYRIRRLGEPIQSEVIKF